MKTWQSLTNSMLPLRLQYPDPTPQGAPTIARHMETETSYRVHLTSEGTDEVYFEVGCYASLPIEPAMEQFIQEVRGRFEGLKSSKIVETTLAGVPARRFSIQWPGSERVVHFLEKDGVLYRIIYDPASALNHRILDTLEFL